MLAVKYIINNSKIPPPLVKIICRYIDVDELHFYSKLLSLSREDKLRLRYRKELLPLCKELKIKYSSLMTREEIIRELTKYEGEIMIPPSDSYHWHNFRYCYLNNEEAVYQILEWVLGVAMYRGFYTIDENKQHYTYDIVHFDNSACLFVYPYKGKIADAIYILDLLKLKPHEYSLIGLLPHPYIYDKLAFMFLNISGFNIEHRYKWLEAVLI